MRISTSQFHNRALESMMTQQTTLSNTQSQVASGKRVQTPSDDPISAVHILELQRAKSESDQFGRNADAVSARLTTEEQALGDSTTLLQRVRELMLQANNSSIDATGRQAIASELIARSQELLDIANRRDGNGEFLFSGYATTTQPFARTGASVTYAGDQGDRVLQTGPTQRVADSNSGYQVFQNIVQGNGTFVTGVNSANTGTGVITTGSVVTPAAWVADTYTLSFTSATTWEVRNAATTLVASGAYTAGNAIAFNGVQVSVSGAPATGDAFTIAQSTKEDIFTSIDKIVNALQTANDSPMSRAQFASQMNTSLEQLDRADSHLQDVRSDIGSRLSLLDDAQASRADFVQDVQNNLSNLQDIDYAEAISRMNRQYLGLQAAQQSYSKISQLSLFNYL
jgi:flagellar hook-associated protein 3 FlgL